MAVARCTCLLSIHEMYITLSCWTETDGLSGLTFSDLMTVGTSFFAIHTKGTTGSKSLRRQVFEDCRQCVIIVELDVVATVYAWLNHVHYSGMSDTDTSIDIISPLARINVEVVAVCGS